MKTAKITNKAGCRQSTKSFIPYNTLFFLIFFTTTCFFSGTTLAQTWRLTGPPEFIQSQDDWTKGGIFQPGTSRKFASSEGMITTTLNSRTANSVAFTTTHERYGTGTISYSWDSPPELLHAGEVLAFTIRWNIGQKYSDFCPQMGTLVHLDFSEDWYTTQWYGYSNHPVSPATGQESNSVIKVTTNNPTELLFYVDVHSTPGDVRLQWKYRRVEGNEPPSSGGTGTTGATGTTGTTGDTRVNPKDLTDHNLPVNANCPQTLVIKFKDGREQAIPVADIEKMDFRQSGVTIDQPISTVNPAINIARGKRATQSSTGYGGTPEGAIDGVKNGGYGFHTENEKNPWWQVDLGAVTSLGEIRIFNRRDCCSERSRTLQVLLSDDGVNWRKVFTNPGTVFGTDGTPLRVSVKGNAARYVRLQLGEAEYFHLDEVEIYGG